MLSKKTQPLSKISLVSQIHNNLQYKRRVCFFTGSSLNTLGEYFWRVLLDDFTGTRPDFTGARLDFTGTRPDFIGTRPDFIGTSLSDRGVVKSCTEAHI